MPYTLSDFDYDLPEGLIAQQPADPRDHARLLVYNRATKSITDDVFYNLSRHLPDSTTLVVNNSKVEKCRLLFDEGKMEIFILESVNDHTVRALVRPGKKFRKGKLLQITDKITAKVTGIEEDGIRVIDLYPSLSDPVYDRYKYTPFPPYIEQNEQLSEEYQTVYARPDPSGGSKAAPTAGLHFTDRLLDSLIKKGYGRAEVTLHVGLGTFAPVKKEQIEDHVMHSEWYQIDGATAEKLNAAPHRTAVGTTSVRVLESAWKENGPFRAESGETGIFIRPGFRFRAVDALITNFHLPKSTLLMLVAAFMGFSEMHRVYRHAIEQKYRFYSFGDAMLIL